MTPAFPDSGSLAPPNSASRPPPRSLLFLGTLGLFVCSGAAGLVDQLCFAKYLGYVVGATAYAVSAVLAAFMTGLALGAYLGGKLARRVARPLAAYGALEIVVAAAVALTPLGFRALGVYVPLARQLPDSLLLLSVLRWSLALLLVIVPTTAMGATLPLLSRWLEIGRRHWPPGTEPRRLAALYAANTLGGALGALGAAYWVLPALGLTGALLASALISLAVGVAALLLGRAREATAALPAESVDPVLDRESSRGDPLLPRSQFLPSRRERTLLPVLAFASGALVFAAEVTFTHLLALVIGNSAYAFGLILAAFLSWLFLGASLAPLARRRLGEAALPLGLLASALALLASLPVWDELPVLFGALGKTVTSFTGRELVRGATAFGVLLAPTVLMGLTFPLLLLRVTVYANIARQVGRLTTVNTIGAVVGSLATGYVVLPALGSEGTLRALGVVLAGIALAACWRSSRALVRGVALGATLATALAFLLPRWDLVRLTSGNNVYFEGHKSLPHLVWIREDIHGGVTTVAEEDGVHTLYTNGKFQGNTGWEMQAQRFFAHYPSLFVERFDEALVIGLGTGTTLGTLAAYPWRRLTQVEISAAIVEAAGRYFRPVNGGVLDDPRVELRVADGRNHLLVDERKYDLVSMELSSIWFAGASSLYSAEFYELVRARLRPHGVFQQWVQLHHIRQRDFATIVNTLRQAFPHVALFYGGGQGVLVASPAPLRASRARLADLEGRPSIRASEPFGRPLVELLDDVLALGTGLDRFLAESAAEAGEPVESLVSTDDNLYLEYATPRGNVLPWEARERLVERIRRFHDPAAIAALLVP